MLMTMPSNGAKLSWRPRSDLSSLVVAAAFALLTFGSIAQALAQTPVGSVTVLTGTASLQRAGNTYGLPVGTPVYMGDQITVNSGHLSVTLADGSILKAGATTVLNIDDQLLGPSGASASTKIELFAGILRSIVMHTSSGSPPNFQVYTPNAVLSVRGTKFDTSYSDGASRIGFSDCVQFTDIKAYEGHVGVRNAADPSSPETMIDAGYETTVACDLPPLSPAPLGATGNSFGDVDTLLGDVLGTEIAPPSVLPGGGPGFGPVPGGKPGSGPMPGGRPGFGPRNPQPPGGVGGRESPFKPR
jgi:hypothetical protein